MQFEEQSRQDPNVRVYTLGTFRVLVSGQAVEDHAWRRRTARQLFKVLLTRPGRRMTRDEVVELFWPDSDTEAAASNLRSTIYAMRRALSAGGGSAVAVPDVIFGDHSSVWLGTESHLWMDAVAFEKKVAEAWRSPDPLPLLEEASALYAGDFLPDDLFEDWSQERREALKRTWTELQFGLAQALESRSDINGALQPLERLLRTDGCNERAAQEQMKLLTRHGRRAEAVRIYQRLTQSLHDELGVEPAPDTAELYRQVLAGEAVAAPPIPPASFRCTYPFPAPSELFGRDSELSALSQVLSSGRTAGRLALLGAPSGTGKSALLGQIVRQAQAQGVLCLAGGCYEERGSVPLGPFHDALVDYLLAQTPETLRAQLTAVVDDLAEVFPELRYHLQLPAPSAEERAPRDRMRTFGAIHASLRVLAEAGPVLLCLEDLHAADEATLQLLHYLARQTRRLPLVMVATYRDDEARFDEPLAQTLAALVRERLAQSIRISALGPDETRQLIGALLDGSPSPALGESLYMTTGGNPLFVEQLVLALAEAGQLERREGVWHATGEQRRAPHIVREVIAQRLRRLDASCRAMLDLASVLGQSFDHRVLLAAVAPLQEAALLRDLDTAITAQVLQDTAGGYAFRHSLLRDAVYYVLTGPKRMLLHLRAAGALEQVFGSRADEHAAELAHHFTLAGESSELRAKRLHYSLLAGRRAAQLSAYPQALDHFSRAWEMLQQDSSFPDLDLQLEILQGRGWAETQMARWRETIGTYRQALQLAKDPIARARAHGLIAFSIGHIGDLQQVVEECRAGLAELVGNEGPDVTGARMQLHQMLAVTLHWQGRYHELVRLGEVMQEEAERFDQPRPRMLAHAVAAWAYWGLGQLRKANEHLQVSAQAAAQIGEKLAIATCSENLGLIATSGGQLETAREYLERALELFRDSASELRAVNSLQTLCRVWVAQGECARAREHLEQVLPLEVEGGERWAADGYCILGTIQMLAGEWDAAAVNFEQAIQMRRQAGHRAGAAEATIGQGLVLQRTGRWAAASDAYDAAARISGEMDECPSQVMAQRQRGLLYLIAGDLPGAAVAIEDAYELARRMPETVELAPSELAMARLRAAQGDRAGALELAREALADARPLHHQIEAHAFLGTLYATAGESDLARKHADEAVTQAQKLGSAWVLSEALLSQAEALAAANTAEARGVFERAIQNAQRARAPYQHARALSAYAAYLRATEETDPTLISAEAESRRIFDELGSWKRARAAEADK